MRSTFAGPASIKKPAATPSPNPSPSAPTTTAPAPAVAKPTPAQSHAASSAPHPPASSHPPSSSSSTSLSPSRSPSGSPASNQQIRVYASDADPYPLAQFTAGSASSSSVLQTLKLSNGGLKIKGGSDTFISGKTALPANDYVVIGASGIRVRVVCKGNKLIVPYPFPTHQVQQLMEEIALRFSRFHTGPGDLKIAELRTLDGYLLGKYDRIMETVYDGDQLEAIDFDIWVKEQVKLCKDSWLQVSQSDYVDSEAKWAEVGRHAHGKLYVQMGTGKEVERLELFEIEDLKMFAKEGKQQILSLNGKQDNFEWHVNASFVITGGQVASVILEVKSLSDPRALIKELKVKIENNTLQKGDIRVVQVPEDDDQSNEKPLPPPKKSAPPIVEVGEVPPAPLVSAQAMQKLKIEQVEKIYADQTWASSGTFNNFFYINFSFTNPNDSIVTIAKVKTEYQGKNGEWVAAKQTAVGVKYGFYDYNWDWNSPNFSISAHQVDKVAILCGIPITAPQVDRLRRAHYTLPSPLKIRVTFEDDQGESSSLIVTYNNPPHELPTKESIEKYNSKKYDFWAELDDKEAECRHYIAVARVDEDEKREYLDVKISPASSTYYFYKTDLQKFAFEAAKNGTDTVEIESLAVNSDGIEAHAYAMVDLAKRKVYAIKWTLSAHGAHLEDYYRISPPLKYVE